jgi:hypothetical protein
MAKLAAIAIVRVIVTSPTHRNPQPASAQSTPSTLVRGPSSMAAKCRRISVVSRVTMAVRPDTATALVPQRSIARGRARKLDLRRSLFGCNLDH